ncbi:hypothetical protein F4780DRAFT_784407 [Xylariomycetidae sp. FL0641]|nr:hypothetical protein F4780DRAFT_784407 [Xylariomycetidae sp. FL0641]
MAAPANDRESSTKRKRADSREAGSIGAGKKVCLGLSLSLCSDDEAKVLDSVEAAHDIQLQSVLSSSKIQKRVAAVLRHLDPAKPRAKMAVLRARAADAGKLVSIAEIAKREIEKEARRGSGDGRWFQYIALGEERKERPRDEDKSFVEETVLSSGPKETPTGEGDDAAEEDDFEVMKTPFERAIEGKPLIRATPIMSLFLSRTPVEELKRRYGEQTNTPPASQPKG